MSSSEPLVCDRARTAQLLDFASLMRAVAQAAVEYDAGQIVSPERMVVPLTGGGVLLSMPATAADVAIHKLVNVQPANAQQGLATINGLVTVCDGATGLPLCILDGPEVTGRRTAAVTMLALRALSDRSPSNVLLFGTGAQARHHVEALRAIFPAARLWIRGTDAARTEAFCRSLGDAPGRAEVCPAHVPDEVDAVVTLTTSTEPIYDEVARAGRVVVGVGAFKPEMAELGRRTLSDSELYADDPLGARHEAGDLMRAGIDWASVRSLGSLLSRGHDPARPAVFKSVGTGAWDLAAARVAWRTLKSTA